MAVEITYWGVVADAIAIRDENLFRRGLFQKKDIYTVKYNYRKYKKKRFKGDNGRYEYCIHISPSQYAKEGQLLQTDFYADIIAQAQSYGCTSIVLPQSVKKHPLPTRISLCRLLESILPEGMTVYIMCTKGEMIFYQSEEWHPINSFIKSNYIASPEPEGIRYSLKMDANDSAPVKKTEPDTKPAEAVQLPLEEYIALVQTGFSTVLFRFIDDKGMDDVTVYKKANIHRRTFSRIRTDKDYQPSKNTVFALALALELDYKQTSQLLASAGYAFSHSSKTDIIVEYHICKRIFDIHAVNYALFSFGEKTLGM